MVKADICMLVDNFATNDARVLKEAASLSRAGWHVVVLAYSKTSLGNIPSQETRDDFTILRAGTVITLWDRFFWLPLTYLLAIIGLPIFDGWFMGTSRRWTSVGQAAQSLLAQVDARIYHAHDYPNLVLLNDGQRCVVYDSHELYFDSQGGIVNNLKRWLISRKHRVERRIERKLSQNLAGFITVGDNLSNQLAKTLGVPPPIVVRNAVDLRANTLGLVKFPDSGRIVAHSGNLTPGRHLPELVSALQYLPEDVWLVLLGDGPLKQSLQMSAAQMDVSQRLCFIPAVPPEAVAPTMAQADVAVVLIYSKLGLNGEFALPNKLFEAVAAGVPIVASPNVEIASLVQRYAMGIICHEPSNPRAIAQAIEQALRSESNQRLRIGVEQARAELNWELEERKLIALYQGLLA